MRFGYPSTDDLNLEIATQMAAFYGHTVLAWLPKDGPPDDSFDAIIHDVDFICFDRDDRERLVKALTATPLRCPVAVHSFNLTDEQKQALRNNGVLVFERLETALFEQLHQACAAHNGKTETQPTEALKPTCRIIPAT